MFQIGCFLSSSGGYLNMARQAVDIGANTFQFFTRNPRGFAAKPFDFDDAKAFSEYAAKNGIASILAHAPYTLNPCSATEETCELAKQIFTDDLWRLSHFQNVMYNFHPGSHVGQGTEKGIDKIIDMLNTVLLPDHTTTVLLETMAGKGSEIGGKFEELKAIIDGVELKHRIGVCLDTCHIYDGGYNIVGNLDSVLEEFDRIIGIDRLKAVHLNDSKNPFASHKDRHERIGFGSLGNETFCKLINHPMLKDLPFHLETPNDIEGYKNEIALLKTMRSVE